MRTGGVLTWRSGLGVVLLAALAGCAAPSRPAPAVDARALPAGADVLRTELVFGRAMPDGGRVSEPQWHAFVAEHLAPRFDGFTVIPVTGQSRTQAGRLLAEDSYLVVLLHEPSEKNRAAIEEIRMIYKRLFRQESVPLVSVPARVSF